MSNGILSGTLSSAYGAGAGAGAEDGDGPPLEAVPAAAMARSTVVSASLGDMVALLLFACRGSRKAMSLRYLTPMIDLALGFIGLGNGGGQLAGNLLRHGANLTVRDPDPDGVAAAVVRGARAAASPRELAERVDPVITCLPSPAVSAAVKEGP